MDLLKLNTQSSCLYCGKSYKNKSNLSKHINLCELLYNSKNRKSNEDEIEIPSQRKLYLMLLELGNKYNKLEEKVDEMNKWVVKKKKKINIIEWLNNNINPEIKLETLNEKIIVDDTIVDYLFQNTFIDTVNNLFSNYIYNIPESKRPIFAFIQKINTIYIYQNDDLKWIELSKENLIKFLDKVHMKIQKKFYNWKKNRIDQIREDDILSIKCDKTTIKIMDVCFNQEIPLSKIRSIMYSNLKTDMKSIIEFEIEF